VAGFFPAFGLKAYCCVPYLMVYSRRPVAPLIFALPLIRRLDWTRVGGFDGLVPWRCELPIVDLTALPSGHSEDHSLFFRPALDSPRLNFPSP